MMSPMISHGAPFSLTVTWALILAWHAMAMGCRGVSIVRSKQPALAHLEVSMGIVDHLHPMFKLLGCRPTKTTQNPPRNIMFMSFHWWSLMLIDVHWWSCLEQLLSICCLSSIMVPVADGSIDHLNWRCLWQSLDRALPSPWPCPFWWPRMVVLCLENGTPSNPDKWNMNEHDFWRWLH